MTDYDPEPLNRMIDQAERDGLVLHCRYQDIWITPQALREQNAKGYLRWGPVNWSTRPASARTDQLRNALRAAEQALEEWEQKTS